MIHIPFESLEPLPINPIWPPSFGLCFLTLVLFLFIIALSYAAYLRWHPTPRKRAFLMGAIDAIQHQDGPWFAALMQLLKRFAKDHYQYEVVMTMHHDQWIIFLADHSIDPWPDTQGSERWVYHHDDYVDRHAWCQAAKRWIRSPKALQVSVS